MAYSVERAKQKLADMKSRKSAWKDYWGTKAGSNRIRILPNWLGEPDGDFFRETGYHRKLGSDRDKSTVCLIKEGMDRCPVCELVKELYKTKTKDDAELAKSIRAQTRILFNIVDLSDLEKGVQVWITGVDVLEQIIGFCANSLYGDITDPETGRNVTVVFTEGKNTKSGYNEYNIQPDPDRTPITDLSWLDQMIDLDGIVKPMSVENIEQLLSGDEQTGAVVTTDIKAAYHQDQAVSVMSCFEKAKYSADDQECVVCVVKGQCAEKKAIKNAQVKEIPTPVTKVETTPEKQPAIVEKAKPSSSDIQQRLDKIRKERAAKTA